MQDILLFLQNHWELSTAIAIVIILLTIVELIRVKRSAAALSPQALTQLINHQDAVVLDIRSLDAFKGGHIVGALSIPLSELDSKYKKLDKYKAKPIVLVCASGLESTKAAALLNQHGLNPSILSGGIRAWRDADMPLVKD